MSVTLPLCLLVTSLSGLVDSTFTPQQEPSGSGKGGSLPVAGWAERGNRSAGFLPSIYDADEASASPRQDMTRGPKPADFEHQGQRCNERPASTYRCTGDASPAARPCPGFPGSQPAATSFAKKDMKTKSPKNAGSKGNAPEESKDNTASCRGARVLREALFQLKPRPLGQYEIDEEEDITEESRAEVRRFYQDLTENPNRPEIRIITSLYPTEQIIDLHRGYETHCPTEGLMSMQALGAEIAPELSQSAFFSALRGAGLISNQWDDWNQACGDPVLKGLLKNRLRIIRRKDGTEFHRLHPYVTPEGKKWLIECLRKKPESQRSSSTKTRSRSKARQKK